jgi:hypothetical protein
MIARSPLLNNSIDGDLEPLRMYRRLEFVACSTLSEGMEVFGFEWVSYFNAFAKETAFFGNNFLDDKHVIEDLRCVAVIPPVCTCSFFNCRKGLFVFTDVLVRSVWVGLI